MALAVAPMVGHVWPGLSPVVHFGPEAGVVLDECHHDHLVEFFGAQFVVHALTVPPGRSGALAPDRELWITAYRVGAGTTRLFLWRSIQCCIGLSPVWVVQAIA